MEQFVQIASSLGVPVAVLAYFMWRDTKFLGGIRSDLAELTLEIRQAKSE